MCARARTRTRPHIHTVQYVNVCVNLCGMFSGNW